MPYSAMDEINRDIPPAVGKQYGPSAILTAFGCVLLEIETAGRITYRAVNLTTGQATTLGRRLNPVTSAEIENLVNKMYHSPVAGPGRYGIDMPPGTNLQQDKLVGILAHIFEKVLPEFGFARRPSQIKLAQQILAALCKRNITLSEAEVGTGKTHAYLIAAIAVKRSRVNDFWLRMSWPKQGYAESAYMPMVITTSSIALQHAIVRDYIPEISTMLEAQRIIRAPITSILRKGKEHYACKKNLRAFYNVTEAANQKLLQPFIRGDVVDIGEVEGLSPYIKRHICVTHCDRDCTHYASCGFQQHLNSAQSGQYDFQVCNHNYLLADTVRRSKGQPPLIPHYQGMVIDEAHKFLGAARQMYGATLDSAVLPRLAEDLYQFKWCKGVSAKSAQDTANKLAGQSLRLFELLANHIAKSTQQEESERFSTVIDAQAVKHLRNIRTLASGLDFILKEKRELSHYAGRKKQMLWQLETVREQAAYFIDHKNLVYWMETTGSMTNRPIQHYALCAIPKKLGELLYRDIWGKGFPVVLTSGTLSASGNFTYVRQSLGINKVAANRLMEASHPSPFDHKNHAMLYISQSVPFPNNHDSKYLGAVADETEKLVLAAHGHTAVLFTSYKAMGIVYKDLSARGLPFPLFRMDKGHTAEIDRFRESDGGVLFASGALWEGIDLPGDALSMLVLVKLPFAVPDPISSYEQTQYTSMARYKNAVVVPEMIVKLKQGFGRLIRSETDTGVVALLDSRARKGGPYHRRVLDALPPCRVTSEIAEVEEFIKNHKEAGYFK